MTTAQICILLTIVAYLCLMIFVGVHFGKKNAGGSSNEFYLGGRQLGPYVTAMSAEASDMSSYLLMGSSVSEKNIGALVEDQEYYFRVDSFNENGITEGMVEKLS